MSHAPHKLDDGRSRGHRRLALAGLESQLQSHIAVSMNVGLTAAQLREVASVLAEAGQTDAAQRMRAALELHLTGPAR